MRLEQQRRHPKAIKDVYDTPVFYDVNISYNNNSIIKLKDITSLSFGCCCGILQLTAWRGISLFLMANFGSSLLFYFLIAGGSKMSKQYFKSPFISIFMGDIARYFSSYVMTWCLLYALVN